MLVAMVSMLVPGLRWPALPQILFFGLAAWWFALRAVSLHPDAGEPAASPWLNRTFASFDWLYARCPE